jgi:signal transduction histidine kinase
MSRILTVDDRPENNLAMQTALRDCDAELVTVSSGPEALACVEREEFALILLDVQMPGMDGFETARRIRALPHGCRVPILFLTAIDRSDAYETQGYLSGAVDFLFKPLNLPVLQAKVKVFIEMDRMSRRLQAAAIERRENELLREAVRLRDEFLSVVSHELKTPLTPLSLNLQFFRNVVNEDQLASVPREKLSRMIGTSCHQLDRLSRLVQELLELSRADRQDLELQREPVDLVALVRETVAAFEHECRKAGCTVSIEAGGPVVGRWDRFRIEQVVINLLSNALRYGAGSPVRIGIGVDGDRAMLSVRDGGIGIAPADHGRIFEKFARAVPTRNYGGLGLGLYITRRIVARHGGTISVDSALGQGAHFVVELPLGEPATSAG